jgi:hypothetical protein
MKIGIDPASPGDDRTAAMIEGEFPLLDIFVNQFIDELQAGGIEFAPGLDKESLKIATQDANTRVILSNFILAKIFFAAQVEALQAKIENIEARVLNLEFSARFDEIIRSVAPVEFRGLDFDNQVIGGFLVYGTVSDRETVYSHEIFLSSIPPAEERPAAIERLKARLISGIRADFIEANMIRFRERGK